MALAAASTAGFVMWLAQTIGEGLAAGSGSVIAAAVGSGSRHAVRRAAAAGQGLAVWGSVVVLVLGLLSNRAIFEFMGTDRPVTEAGIAYMVVILLGMPAYFSVCVDHRGFPGGRRRRHCVEAARGCCGHQSGVGSVADFRDRSDSPQWESRALPWPRSISWLVACFTRLVDAGGALTSGRRSWTSCGHRGRAGMPFEWGYLSVWRGPFFR